MGSIPLSVPEGKPVHILTHTSWVRVQTGMGKDRVNFTRGLPMSRLDSSLLGFNLLPRGG